LFKNKTYLVNLIVMTILWTVSSFDYYMINFQLKYIQGNVFLNSGFSSMSEAVAYGLGGIMVQKMGTKNAFISAFMFSVAGSLCLIFINPETVDQLVLAFFVLASKFGVSATFVMVYVVTLDFFPEAVAASAFGFCNLFARAFSFLSPEIAEVRRPVPMVLFCLAAIGASIATLFLKSVKQDDKQIDNKKSDRI